MALIKVSNLEEVTFSTGTGDLVLSGPGRGGKGLYTRCVPGDTFRYYIHGVGSNGLPEDEWEAGFGTYKANNTIERTSVENSSNNGSKVNFSAGTKYLRVEGTIADGIRESQSAVPGDGKIGGQLADALSLPGSMADETLLVLGDSTGNAQDEWVYLYAQRLAAALPSEVRVEYTAFNDGTGQWSDTYILKPGLGQAGIRVGSDNRGWSFLRSTVQVSGTDLDARVLVAPDSWNTGTTQTLLCQYGGSGQRAWRLFIDTSGRLAMSTSTDGTGGGGFTLTSTAALGYAAGTQKWLRCTLDTDNGAGGYTAKLQSSDDGITWVDVGASTGGAPTSIFPDATNVIEIGSRSGNMNGAGSTDACQGVFYRAHLSYEVDGGNGLPFSIRRALQLFNQVGQPVGGPTLRVMNASLPGRTMSYLIEAARFAKIVPIVQGGCPVFVSSLHNEPSNLATYTASLKATMDAVKTRIGGPRWLITTQNPQYSPRTPAQIFAQASKAAAVRQLAPALGMTVVDTFKAFGTAADLVATDGLHPNASGTALWLDTVWSVAGA